MTIEEIKEVVQTIREDTDNEVMHGKEDDLYKTVLGFIASGWCADPREYASEALEAAKIDYTRWYAQQERVIE